MIVVTPGCTSATAHVTASRAEVRVLELPAGKVAALSAADAAAAGYPLIYPTLTSIHAVGVSVLDEALAASHAALRRRRRWPLPRYRCQSQSAVGKGRGRFGWFLDVVADDLSLDSPFSVAEKQEVGSVSVPIAAPRCTRDLLRRRAWVRRGNGSMRRALAATENTRGAARRRARTSWLHHVALRNPVLIPATTCHAAITLTASIMARLPQRPGDSTWGRDDSSRPDDYHAHNTEAADDRG